MSTVVGHLPAFGVDTLYEVTLLVEQTDGDEGQTKVTGRLTVVSGQDAKPTGVDGKALVQAKFGTKVGHQLGLLGQILGNLRVRAIRQVAIVSTDYTVKLRHIGTVLGSAINSLLGYPAQKHFWVMADLLP